MFNFQALPFPIFFRWNMWNTWEEDIHSTSFSLFADFVYYRNFWLFSHIIEWQILGSFQNQMINGRISWLGGKIEANL